MAAACASSFSITLPFQQGNDQGGAGAALCLKGPNLRTCNDFFRFHHDWSKQLRLREGGTRSWRAALNGNGSSNREEVLDDVDEVERLLDLKKQEELATLISTEFTVSNLREDVLLANAGTVSRTLVMQLANHERTAEDARPNEHVPEARGDVRSVGGDSFFIPSYKLFINNDGVSTLGPKAAAVLKMEESLFADKTLSRRVKRPWQGPIRVQRRPPQPPWSEEDCALRVEKMLMELLEDDDTGSWAAANVLDSWVGKITRVDLSNVIRELGSCRYAGLALEVFKWMQQQKRRLKPNKWTYSLILGVLGRGGLTTEAREIFDSMLSVDVEVSVHSYNAMIGAYSQSRNFKKAWRLYEDMVTKGIRADEITFNTLLNVVGRANLPVEKAEKIFLRLKQKGFLPGVQSYNTLISVLSKAGHVERCRELDTEMRLTKTAQDLVTYNSLLIMHVRGGRVEEAMEVFQRLTDAGVEPNVITYTGLIQMYSRASKHQEAIILFLRMQEVGCKPDLITYSLMISVYGRAGFANEAALVFRQIQEAGFKPNVVTWSSIIQVFGWQGKCQDVGAYYKEMLASGCQPDVTLYNILMGAYGRKGRSVQAAIIFRRMQAHSVPPNAVSYDTMIQAYCHSKQPADAQGILDQMTRAGYTPDRVSCAMLQVAGVKFTGDSRIHLSRKERRSRNIQGH